MDPINNDSLDLNKTPNSADAPALVRVSKLMTEKGICSRREADQLIERGLVYVDGEKVQVLGTKVSLLPALL
jgi:23S rRNA pseudouridine2604 synthase